MTSIDPPRPTPVVYISAPVGILNGVSQQIIDAGGAPIVGWLATGLFATPSSTGQPDTLKHIVAKADCMFVPGIVSGDMNLEVTASTEAGIPVFNTWTDLTTFMDAFGLPD